MKDRLNAMCRVLAVQSQVKRLAEWQLAAAESRKLELETRARELDGFLEHAGLSGGLALLGLRQRRRIAVREAGAESERAVQADLTRQARSREKLAERLVEGLAAEDRRETEKRELERLIEGLAGKGADAAEQ